MASIFGTCFALPSEAGMAITSRASSIFIVGASIGDVCMPVCITHTHIIITVFYSLIHAHKCIQWTHFTCPKRIAWKLWLYRYQYMRRTRNLLSNSFCRQWWAFWCFVLDRNILPQLYLSIFLLCCIFSSRSSCSFFFSSKNDFLDYTNTDICDFCGHVDSVHHACAHAEGVGAAATQTLHVIGTEWD